MTNVTISDEAIEAITGSIALRASRDLIVNKQVDLTKNNDVTLQANRDVVFNAAINGARNLTVTADADHDASGDVSLNVPLNSIKGAGIFSGNRIFLNGGSVMSIGQQRYFGDLVPGREHHAEGDEHAVREPPELFLAGCGPLALRDRQRLLRGSRR
jgi:hypothetical protein